MVLITCTATVLQESEARGASNDQASLINTVFAGAQVRVGGVVSRTVMVWMQLAELPQASVAVQVRAMTLVPVQPLVVASLKVTVTWLQVSVAVATPVLLVVVSAGHSRTR